MTEQYIVDVIKQKAIQLGVEKYSFRSREINIPNQAEKIYEEFNSIFFLVTIPTGVTVYSDYGVYNKENPLIEESKIEHRGVIKIKNHTDADLSISIVQMILS